MSDDDLTINVVDDDLPPSPAEQPTVDAATPAGRKKQERRIRREQRERDAFWLDLLNRPVGRREIWGLLQAAHAFEERFACGPNGFPQTEATWFHAGEQNFGLRLYQNLLRVSPVLVALMHAEHDPRFPKPRRGAAKENHGSLLGREVGDG